VATNAEQQAGISLKAKKPQRVRDARASDVKTYEGNHEMNNSTASSNVIPFRSAKLLLVDQDGEPFVAMKPVVEGMGLDWKTQYRKLQAGRFDSVMVIITTTGADGKMYEMSCMPLRKLPGWLMSIHASKVRLDLRANVLAYQNECDDALWAYWNEGHAVNARGPVPITDLVHTVIGTTGELVLDQVIDQKGSQIPATLRRSFKQTMKSRLRTRFNVQKTALIPAESLADACNFVVAYNVDGEWIPSDYDNRVELTEVSLPAASGFNERWLVSFNHKGEQQIEQIADEAYVLTQREYLTGIAKDGDIPLSTEEMIGFTVSLLQKVQARYRYSQSRKKSA
jgi:hypothetical protein